ncbi:MAG TPA: ABC transporter permease [Bacteroidetes bacterium]|nr:ABC transporter permease [Bacteroidota bacterium]
MNFPFYIAKRYLVAKKSHNVINLISFISVIGVMVGTMALVVVLSSFNGFDDLVHSLFNSFDPDLKITPAKGKTFPDSLAVIKKVKHLPEVMHAADVVEENALLQYRKRQYIATVKGVSDEYTAMSGVDSMMVDGAFVLHSKGAPMAVLGQGIAINLGVGLNFISPIKIYVPRRTKHISLNPERAFNKKYIFPSGVFAIQQDFDLKYMIVPLEFARELFGYTYELSAVELKFKPGVNNKQTEEKIENILGADFLVKNRYEQQALLYRIMKTEKWVIFLILTFILIIASFNVIGSLSMLIIEKKEDIMTFRNLGGDHSLIRRIFLFEGWMITIVGAVAGIALGLFICWLQLHFGIVKIPGSGSFVIDTYPVKVQALDILLIFLTVLAIGYGAAWYPVRFIIGRLVRNDDRSLPSGRRK